MERRFSNGQLFFLILVLILGAAFVLGRVTKRQKYEEVDELVECYERQAANPDYACEGINLNDYPESLRERARAIAEERTAQ